MENNNAVKTTTTTTKRPNGNNNETKLCINVAHAINIFKVYKDEITLTKKKKQQHHNCSH